MTDQDALGTIAWTERTNGILSRNERRALMAPLLRGTSGLFAGQVARALRLNSGRHAAVDPATLTPPDSALAREAEVRVAEMLSPAVLNHSHRAYAWGAALGALDGIAFDRELFYLASLFHDTGIESPDPGVDFTVRSAAAARSFLENHGFSAADGELVANAIALHHTPGVGPEHGGEAYLLSAGAGVDVFGLRSHHLPPAVLTAVVADHPRLGFKREFSKLWRTEARQVKHGRAWYLHRYAVSGLTIRMAPFRG